MKLIENVYEWKRKLTIEAEMGSESNLEAIVDGEAPYMEPEARTNKFTALSPFAHKIGMKKKTHDALNQPLPKLSICFSHHHQWLE